MTDPYGTEFTLASDYTVFVQPLPPYYKDLVEQQFPLPEYPKRKIQLIAGDVVDWPYEPPDVPVAEDHVDYDLYMLWNIADKARKEIVILRNVARVDYLLAMCVRVIEGEFTLDSDEWASNLEAAFPNFQVPEHKGKRYLLFLKHVVIRSAEEMDLVISMCTSPEVTMQGVINALRGFQDKMEEGRFDRGGQ